MSQALPDQPRWVDGKKVDCNGAPWIDDMDVLPDIPSFDWREQMELAKKMVKQAEEDEAVNKDDQSNETLNKDGELVEAPENNENPENLKRKKTMVNGSTPNGSIAKKAKQGAITTVNALKHVKEMKANVAMINASDVEEMDKAIKEIDMDIREFKEYGIPGMERVVKNLSSRWELLRGKLLRGKLQ